jgi:hypothetical protein
MAQQNEQFGNSEQLAQQTAVEWFAEMITDMIHESHHSELADLYERAKEIDRQQKKAAWDRGKYIGESFPQKQIEPEYEQEAEEYYTQTYGK